MLSPHEFTVGAFADAAPLSLIIPRTQHEATALVGRINEAAAAVFLSGQYMFHCFETEGNRSWHGLIVPNVGIEVDETSLFDPSQNGAPLGSIIRADRTLAIKATRDSGFGGATLVTLYDSLPPVGDLRAGFVKWQVVIGKGPEKRVLWRSPDAVVSPS